MSYPIVKSLLKFPEGLELYMKRDGKMLNGIILRKMEYLRNPVFEKNSIVKPIFDVTAEDSRKSRKGIVHQHLDNYFNCYALDLTRYRNPPILESLFVAKGVSAHYSLQDILNKNDNACAIAGSIPRPNTNVLDNKLNCTEVTTATTATTSETLTTAIEVLNRLRAKHEALRKELELIALIEAQLKANQTLKEEIAEKRKILETPECKYNT
jgi:hypothetical protein